MIEEDLFFPGKPFDDDDDTSTLSDDGSILTRKASNSSTRQTKTVVDEGEETISGRTGFSSTTPGLPRIPNSPRATANGRMKDKELHSKDLDRMKGAHNSQSVTLTKRGGPKIIPFLLRPVNHASTVAPHNPRDHTILEAIWHGMLESRFVNSSPLSLLTTYLEYHFKGRYLTFHHQSLVLHIL